MTRNVKLTMLVSMAAALVTAAQADQPKPPDAKELSAVVDRALAFFRTRQTANGSFSSQRAGPGITALVAAGLIRHGHGDDPVVQKALKYLEGKVQPDGGIDAPRLANYTTSVALVAFKEANTKGQYDAVIANAVKFLKSLQSDDEAMKPDDAAYGGVGYDGRGRPDMSNTAYFVDALIAAGVPKDDPAIKRTLTYLGRCQNLPGETNDRPFAKKATPDDKGGFVYTNAEPKANDPRATPQGGLRSEGVMTYAGLKSFLYAGVSKDDARVKAAIDWIRRHYTLEGNPGAQGTAGLYYYYHTFAKSMNVLGENPFVDAKGVKHDWRAELFATLKQRQKPDGSWQNANRAFMEDNPDLATAFAVLALSYIPEKK